MIRLELLSFQFEKPRCEVLWQHAILRDMVIARVALPLVLGAPATEFAREFFQSGALVGSYALDALVERFVMPLVLGGDALDLGATADLDIYGLRAGGGTVEKEAWCEVACGGLVAGGGVGESALAVDAVSGGSKAQILATENELSLVSGGLWYSGAAIELNPNIRVLLNYESSNGATAYKNEVGAKENITFGGGLVISNEVARFGNTALKSVNQNQFAEIPLTLNLASLDFTIETWLYPGTQSVSHYDSIFSNGCMDFIVGRNGDWRMYMYTTTGFLSPFESNANNIPINQWSHVALTRSGNIFRIFLNGAQIRTQTISRQFNPGGSVSRVAGRFGSALTNPSYFDGYRILIGSSLYQSNFSVPTAPPTGL